MTAGQRPEGAKIASYPLFAPPEDLATKPTSSWSPSEVKRYKEWLLGSMPARINTLKSTLDLHPFGSPESTLVDAGRKLVALLSEPDASRPGRRETATLRGHEISYDTGPLLTVHSYAITADVGLLMAEMLTDRYDLHWDVVRRRKDAVAYNLPALFGFESGIHMEPIWISTTVGYGVLGGSQGEEAWFDAYRWWADHASARRA